MDDGVVRRYALPLLALVLSCKSGMCAEVPVIREGMTLKAVRAAVSRAGWHGPRHRYCAATGETAKGLRYCGEGYSLAFLRLVPEALDTPTDQPLMNLCYEDRDRHSLQVTFSYREDVDHNAAKLAASLRSGGWTIDSWDCRRP